MKKLAFILLTGLMGILAFGMTGTAAWFTSTEQISGNAITTGTLGLSVEGGPLVATKMEPGGDWKSIGGFCITNSGEFDLKWRGWFKEIDDPKGLKDFLRIRMTVNPPIEPAEANPNYGPTNLVLFENVPFVDLLSDKNEFLLLDSSKVSSGMAPFGPKDRICYRVDAKLTGSTLNNLQDANLTAKLHLFATQWIAPWETP